MNKRSIIVTGGLGFIGFNFIKYLMEDLNLED
jgi:nucleoside-diphosphate-sugar epimerase